MNRRRFALSTLITILAMHTSTTTRAASPTQVFVASANGQQSEVSLQIDGSRFQGVLKDSGGQFPLRGQVQGKRLTGQIMDPTSGQEILPFQAELDGDTLYLSFKAPQAPGPVTFALRRVGAPPLPATAVHLPNGAALDARLLGRWSHHKTTSSAGGAGGFASFSTVRTLVLAADGRMQQWVRSVGGGGQWSHRSGDELELEGRWTTQGAALWVLPAGHAAYVRVAAYQLEGERLVMQGNGGRQIWRR